MIKLIVSDMDGTLVDDKKRIDPKIYDILPKLKKNGTRFIVASGRQYPSLQKFFADHSEDVVIIAENGAFVNDDGKELYASVMEKDLVHRCLDEIEKLEDIEPLLCGKYYSYTTHQTTADFMASEKFQYRMQVVDDLKNVDADIIKISLVDLQTDRDMENNCSTLKDVFGEETEIAISGVNCMDIVNKGVSKGAAIAVLQEKWGISKEETMAFGDNFNDVEMLQQAEYSFAMAHAHDEVKQHANFVAGSNNDGSVVKEICKYINISGGKMKTVASHALGCKVNQYESEAIAELFLKRGYEVKGIEEKADVYIINTCTVTNFGDKKSRQLIRKVKRQNPNAVVAVVGCYAQTAPEEVMAVEGVNLVIGTKDRHGIVELVEDYQKEDGVQNLVTGIMQEHTFEALCIDTLANRTRAYLKIQDGCNQFCSYCIIPYARGPIRSRPMDDVLAEVKRLAKNGFLEVVLTGIHVASYGKDLEDVSLLEAIQKVHEVEGIERIRFSSIEPNVVTEAFASNLANLPKVCDHFHLSLQSGCDKILKAMNRKYDTEKYREAVAILRNHMPDVAITTDIIVGFPGETEMDFETTYAFAKEIGFSKIHVFPYSPKKGTPAAKMEVQLLNEVKNIRSKKLIHLSDAMTETFLQKQIGKELEVLYEKELEKGIYEGHTTNYIKVHGRSTKSLVNSISKTKIRSVQGEIAFGEVE